MTITDNVQPGSPSPVASPAARAVDLVKIYGKGDAVVRASTGSTWRKLRPPVSRPSWARRAPASRRSCTAWPDSTRPRPERCSWAIRDRRARRQRVDGDATGSGRLCLPVLQPRSDADRGRDIKLPADLAGGKVDQGWSDYLVEQLGVGDACRTGRMSCPGASSSASPVRGHRSGRPDLIFADEPTGNLGLELLG